MAYIGKYTDRNPNIKAAGMIQPTKKTMKEALAETYTAEELAESQFARMKCHRRRTAVPEKLQTLTMHANDNNLFGCKESSKFADFRDVFLEQLMFKRAELGKAYDYKTKPENINNSNTTFGCKYMQPEISFRELLAPGEIIQIPKDSRPSQQMNRNYTSPFQRDATFGKPSKVDLRGIGVKNALMTCPISTMIKTAQCEHILQHRGLLGRKNLKYGYAFPVERTAGQPPKVDECFLKELVEDTKSCKPVTNVTQAFTYLHKIRRELSKNVYICLYDLLKFLMSFDVDKTGYLELDEIVRISRKIFIYLDEEHMRTILDHLGMLPADPNDKKVDYFKFVDLIDYWHPLPNLHLIQPELQDHFCPKDTTYRLMQKDLTKPANQTPRLGRCVLPGPEKIHMSELVNTTEYVKRGLTKNDFDEPRDKDQLNRIFSKVLGSKFDEAWAIAKEKYKPANDLISVQQMRDVLKTVLSK